MRYERRHANIVRTRAHILIMRLRVSCVVVSGLASVLVCVCMHA